MPLWSVIYDTFWDNASEIQLGNKGASWEVMKPSCHSPCDTGNRTITYYVHNDVGRCFIANSITTSTIWMDEIATRDTSIKVNVSPVLPQLFWATIICEAQARGQTITEIAGTNWKRLIPDSNIYCQFMWWNYRAYSSYLDAFRFSLVDELSTDLLFNVVQLLVVTVWFALWVSQL